MTAERLDTFGGERVLWVGQPTRIPVFDAVGVVLTAVGVYCVAGATFAIVSGTRDGHATTVILAVLVIACVLAIVVGRPLLRRASLRGTEYLLTETRIVICSAKDHQRVLAAHLVDLSPPRLAMRDGARTGTIRFDSTTIVLLEIENPRQVQQLIATTQAEAP